MSKIKSIASPFSNEILAALPTRDLNRLASQLEIVELTAKQVLHEVDDQIRHVYFPTSSVVARTVLTAEGSSIEVGMAGREGLTGICTFFGNSTSPYRETVLFPGGAIRVDTQFLIQQINRGTALARCSSNMSTTLSAWCRSPLLAISCTRLNSVTAVCCSCSTTGPDPMNYPSPTRPCR